jgi:hypothetical protein
VAAAAGELHMDPVDAPPAVSADPPHACRSTPWAPCGPISSVRHHRKASVLGHPRTAQFALVTDS